MHQAENYVENQKLLLPNLEGEEVRKYVVTVCVAADRGCPGNANSTTSSYLGIWYNRALKKTVVWVANRDNPLTDSTAVLTIAADGNLVIVVGRVSYMLSNISSSGNTSATLLDSGNLVLNDRRSGDILWQSFDYPTDTLLPGMKVGHDKRNGKTWSMLAWKSKEDPGTGVFSFKLDPQGTSQFFILKEFQKYWTSGTRNRKIFTRIPEMVGNYMYDSIYVSNGNESEWDMYWAQPREQCDIYGYCRAFGACNRRAPAFTAFCQCFPGFQPNSVGNWNAGDMSRGCVRKAPLQCSNYTEVNDQKDQFLRMSKVRLPDDSIVLSQVRSVGDCESACFGNCSCSAYAYDGNDGCSIWREELMNVLQLTDNDPEGRDFYLRLSASEFKNQEVEVDYSVPIALLAAVSFFYCLRKRKSQNKGEDLVLFDIGTITGAANCKLNEAGKSRTGKKKDVDLPLFSFASVSVATDNFSDANKLGEGGFGPVYKGKLLTGYEVAVKRLSRNSGQGLEELQNEAMLIAKLQHNNLVRLLGCCIEKDEKILIYENMPNKSLDFFLFGFGYMSQEYASEGLFSIKSDVFSFGVLLLEILSGKRSTGFYNSDSLNLLGYAWDLWKSGRGEGIKDPILLDIPSTIMLQRCVNIALLCIEESAADRPTMSNVVSMLSNEQALLPSPKQPAFQLPESENLVANTDNPRMTNFAHPVFFLIFSFSLFANALTDTILQGQLVRASTTITSSGDEFELGFFIQSKYSTMNSYLGVWYKRVSVQTVVWVANRDYPFAGSSAVLTIAADVNLVRMQGRITYMLSNISSSGNTSATFMDSGNLVLVDGRSGDLTWQSFDYSSDTLLPGMKLGHDKSNGKTWSLLAWKSKEDRPRPWRVLYCT
ncbi:hypothetical protein RHSIM_RhsimUnG0256300 [Rhododendron simsii]|uniref:Non-specific serine/threonine protein kinase n=1 Tax=Rhododendron simsii TaxID=118357 RepID=A0A834FT62_RHOSS|nr:hypothetical protein RHSIM_RhsimUnG0256300 [Rhododendron simsii]